MENINSNITIDELATFCKRKGFVYPSGEIYGGLAGFWDYGPHGVELKNNIKKLWWQYHVQQRDDIAGMDGSIITHPKTWVASGHVQNFNDVYVKCKKCKKPNKIDKHEVGVVKCSCGGEYEVLGNLQGMFTTNVGPITSESTPAYLRPETAQLMFTDFRLIHENARMQLPFGIAQIGKAFRNEISPREFIFRCREFEQMEIEYFIAPKTDCPYLHEIEKVEISIFSEDMQKSNKPPVKMKILDALKSGILKRDWHAYWLAKEFGWFTSLGARPEKFRARQHYSEERSHYSSDTWDLEYEFPMGWRELQGFADRSTYDLSQHQKVSNKSLEINDSKAGKVLPEVVCEPSLGVERAFLVFLLEAYHHNKERDNIILKLNPKLSPVKIAVLPIIKDPIMTRLGQELTKELRKEWSVAFDESGSIGRRYSRNDEIGTPFCIAVDEDSMLKGTVTIRERDSTKQVLVNISEVRDILRKAIVDGKNVMHFGKVIETRVKENPK